MLNRNDYTNNETYLFHLYNDLGFTDLEVCYNYEIKGELRFSKWVRFDYLQSLSANEKVKGTIDTKKEFFDKITHRRILDIEIMYDFDEDENGNQKPSEIKAYAKKCIKKLNDSGIFGECYFSGSKSIHYSVLVPELRNMSKYKRQVFKERALSPLQTKNKIDFKADLLKKSERSMIAIEGQPHWKTGIIKERIEI